MTSVRFCVIVNETQSQRGEPRNVKHKMAGGTRLELATSGVTGQRSNRLSYTPEKGRRNLSEVFCRSSELEKNDPDNRRQGGGCGEHRRRNVPLPESVGDVSPPARLCQPPNIASIQIECPSPVSGPNRGKRRTKMAEREGFEPPLPFQVITLSRRAPSTTQPPLHHADANCVKSSAKRQVI